MALDTEIHSDLQFDPEAILPPAQLHALGKPIRAMDDYLPGFFTASQPPSGVTLLSFNFVRGTLYGSRTTEPKYLYAVHKGDLPAASEADALSIVSGICLFGSGGLRCYGQNGAATVLDRPGVTTMGSVPKIVSVQRAPTQIYVAEAAARLGRTMAALALLARNVYRKPADLFVHIPGAEYKLTAEAVYAYGGITLEALQSYYALVDTEVADITNRFTEIFREAGLPPPVFGSPLDEIVASYKPGCLELSHFKQTPFESAISAVSLAGMNDVSHLSEKTAYLRAIKPGNLPVFVDDYDEWKIYKYASHEPDFRGIALYPLPLCIGRHAQLFYYDSASPEEIARAIAPWD